MSKMYSKKQLKRLIKRQRDIYVNSLKHSSAINESQIETKSSGTLEDKNVSAVRDSNNVAAPTSMIIEDVIAVKPTKNLAAAVPKKPKYINASSASSTAAASTSAGFQNSTDMSSLNSLVAHVPTSLSAASTTNKVAVPPPMNWVAMNAASSSSNNVNAPPLSKRFQDVVAMSSPNTVTAPVPTTISGYLNAANTSTNVGVPPPMNWVATNAASNSSNNVNAPPLSKRFEDVIVVSSPNTVTATVPTTISGYLNAANTSTNVAVPNFLNCIDLNAASSSNNVSPETRMIFDDIITVSGSNNVTATTPAIVNLNALDSLEPDYSNPCDCQNKFIRRQFQLHSEKMETIFKTQMLLLEQRMTEKIQLQNTMILEAFAKQKVYLAEHSSVQNKQYSSLFDKFPIETEKQLRDLNAAISTAGSRERYVPIVRNFMRNGVPQGLSKVLGDGVIFDYNVDGTHGKKRLKDLSHFYELLELAIQALPENEGTPESQLRKALLTNKRKYYKTMFVERKGLKNVQQQQQQQREQSPRQSGLRPGLDPEVPPLAKDCQTTWTLASSAVSTAAVPTSHVVTSSYSLQQQQQQREEVEIRQQPNEEQILPHQESFIDQDVLIKEEFLFL